MSSGPFIPRVPTADPGIAPRRSAGRSRVGDPGQANGRTFIQVLAEGQQSRSASPTVSAEEAKNPGRQLAKGALVDVKENNSVSAMAIRALQAEKKVDALIASVGRGRTFSAAELIALQATVFRYSQTVEIISRAADRVVGAIKQTLGTQV